MCSDCREDHGCGQKKQKVRALLCLAQRPLPNAVNSSDVPTEFAAELKKEKVLKDKFRFITFLLLLSLLKGGSPWDFVPKTRDTAQGYLKCVPPRTGYPVVPTDRSSNVGSPGEFSLVWMQRFDWSRAIT